jgi:bis(5'-nucleosidyl)-tetraphosphatase
VKEAARFRIKRFGDRNREARLSAVKDDIAGVRYRMSMEERSAGAVLLRETPDGRLYLLLMNMGRWDFPKGNIEKGESEVQTVMREVAEETGLSSFRLVPGFKRVIEYFYRRDGTSVHKEVTYYLATTTEEAVRISSEHQGYAWLPYEAAKKKASYGNSKEILTAAEDFLKSSGAAAPAQN